MSNAGARVGVVLEVVPKRSFASALDWPGWCRSGSTPDAALEALAAYADRYATVAAVVSMRLPTVRSVDSLIVVEEIEGDATTGFGAPSKAATAESGPATAKESDRAARLLDAAWTVLDDVVASAPAELRKGPRGGGRHRDAMFEHVIGAEHAYAGKIGVRLPQPSADDAAAIRAVRVALLEVIRADRNGRPARENGWPPRYCARRLAWHALDHAWEMQDRSTP